MGKAGVPGVDKAGVPGMYRHVQFLWGCCGSLSSLVPTQQAFLPTEPSPSSPVVLNKIFIVGSFDNVTEALDILTDNSWLGAGEMARS